MRPASVHSAGSDTAKDVLRVAVVGVGQIACQSHIPAVLSCAGVRLAALVDPVTARAAQVARQFGMRPAIAGDIAEVLDDIDVAIIATPNHHHRQAAVACLDAGVSTLIEKPLAQTYDEGSLIVEAARRSGAALAVGYCSRFRRNVALLKSLLDTGYFGTVRTFVHQAGTCGGWAPLSGYNLDRASAGGGVLMVTGSHFLDRMLFLWGYPDAVEYMDDSEGGPEANCRAVFRHARSGTPIEGYAFYSKTVFLPAVLKIRTDRGCLVVRDQDDGELVFHPHGDRGIEQVIRVSGDDSPQPDVFRLQLEDFIRAHRERRAPLVDGMQGLQSLRLIESLYACRRTLESDWYETADPAKARAS